MLRIIATFILIYLVFRVLTTIVFPWIARLYLNRYKKRFYRENPWAAEAGRKSSQEASRWHREKAKGREADTDRLGEYVDYEEIEEDSKNGNKQ